LRFAGHGDWRLPNVRELESIVDYGESNPAADPVFRAENGSYWTSTTDVSAPTKAFVVSFRIGAVVTSDKVPGGVSQLRAFVRAVRGGS
jgi:hypothetical protein